MGQIEQHEHDGTHQQQSTEQAQVAQCHRLERYESEESADGGDVTHDEGHHNLLERRTHVGGVL